MAEVDARLATWAGRFAAGLAPGLARGDPEALRRVADDERAVTAAVERAVAAGDVDLASRIVVDLTFSWSLRGRCARGRALVDAVLAAAPAPSASLLWAAGFLTLYDGDFARGIELAQRAIDAAGKDARVRARAMILLGMATSFVAPADAEPLLRRAAALAAEAEVEERTEAGSRPSDTEAGDGWAVVEARQMLAYTFVWRGDPRSAVVELDASMPALDAIGHPQLRAWDAAARAEAAAQSGRLAEAVELGRRGIELARRVEEPVSASGALLPLVAALILLGRAADAATVIEDVAPFFDSHPGLATRESLLAARAAAAAAADPVAALPVLDQAHEATSGIALVSARMGVLRATALLVGGEVGAASADAAQALALFAGLGDVGGVGAALAVAVAADVVAGAEPDTTELLAALGVALDRGLRPVVADGLDVLGAAALDRRATVAAHLHAAAARLRTDPRRRRHAARKAAAHAVRAREPTIRRSGRRRAGPRGGRGARVRRPGCGDRAGVRGRAGRASPRRRVRSSCWSRQVYRTARSAVGSG
ncbi:MAG: hypothetical protein ACT4RN_15220 [Pseudonocardia sp.]